MSDKVGSIPQTPIGEKEKITDLKEPKLNLSSLVRKFVLAQIMHDMCKAQGISVDAAYFMGIAQGYSDFFQAMALPPTILQTIMGSLDAKAIEEEARELMKGQSILLTPDNSVGMLSLLKRGFDAKIAGKL